MFDLKQQKETIQKNMLMTMVKKGVTSYNKSPRQPAKMTRVPRPFEEDVEPSIHTSGGQMLELTEERPTARSRMRTLKDATQEKTKLTEVDIGRTLDSMDTISERPIQNSTFVADYDGLAPLEVGNRFGAATQYPQSVMRA